MIYVKASTVTFLTFYFSFPFLYNKEKLDSVLLHPREDKRQGFYEERRTNGKKRNLEKEVDCL